MIQLTCTLLFVLSFALNFSAEAQPKVKPFENRCGWLANPTPANWWLTDRDGTWVIGVQGGYQVSDTSYDQLPTIPPNDIYWENTNGSYGTGCACLLVTVDKKEMRILDIRSGKALPLSKCRHDPAIKQRN